MPDPAAAGATRPHDPGGDTALILYRLAEIEKKVDEMLTDHERRIRILEETQTRLSERLTSWQMAQGVYATIMGVVATILGRIR